MCQGKSSISGIIKVLLVVSITMSLSHPCEAIIVNRINYGIVFEKVATMDAVYDYWTHTYRIQLPAIHRIAPYTVACTNTSTLLNRYCREYQAAFQNVDQVRTQYMHSLNDTFSQIKELMPVGQMENSGSRSKRKVLGFIADIAHHVFGFATDKEVTKLAKHMMAMESKQNVLHYQMAQIGEDLSSFMTLSNHRFNNMKQIVTDNHNAIMGVAHEIQTLSNTIQEEIGFTALLIKESYYMMSLQYGLQEFLQGIHDLFNHKLPINLVPYKDIKHVISRVNTKLTQQHSRLQVKHMTAYQVYKDVPFIWTSKHHQIYITVKLPLVAPMTSLDVFRINYFAVPLNATTNHATKLMETHKYIALSTDQLYYAFPEENMIQNSYIDAQTYDLPLHPVVQPSCLSAVYFDNKAAIQEKCDFRVLLHDIKPQVKHLHNGQYLISNVDNIFLTCNTGLQRHDGCRFCVFTVPCLCDVATTQFYFPPRLAHCSSENDTATMLHPVNLAIMLNFYKQEDILHVEADKMYKEIPLTNIPPIHMFAHNLSEILANDKMDDMSLKRIAQSVKREDQVYQSLAEPVLESLQTLIQGDDFPWTTILTIINSVLIILTCSAMGYVYYKTRVLHAALLAVATLPTKVATMGIQVVPTTTIVPSTTVGQTPQQDNTVSYIIIGLVITVLIFMLYRYLTKISIRATIALEISNGTECVMVPLIHIPHCPKFYHCQAETGFSDMRVNGWLKPVFSWNKGNLHITHLLDRSRPEVPEQIPVSIMTACKLRRLFRGTMYAYLMATHAKYVFQLNICPLSCRTCTAKLNAVESPPEVQEAE